MPLQEKIFYIPEWATIDTVCGILNRNEKLHRKLHLALLAPTKIIADNEDTRYQTLMKHFYQSTKIYLKKISPNLLLLRQKYIATASWDETIIHQKYKFHIKITAHLQ